MRKFNVVRTRMDGKVIQGEPDPEPISDVLKRYGYKPGLIQTILLLIEQNQK